MLIILICKKSNIDRWFHAIQVNAFIRFALLIAIFIIMIVLFILNFEYDVLFLLVSAVAIFIVGLSIWPTIIKLYNNTIGMISVHDLMNGLISINCAMYDLDLEELRDAIRTVSIENGIDVKPFEQNESNEKLEYSHKVSF